MSDLGILFVLDPNFFLCWESILIDETTEGLLAWISSLKDVFTRSSESPTGLDLEVRHKALLDLCHAKTVHSAMTAIQKSTETMSAVHTAPYIHCIFLCDC